MKITKKRIALNIAENTNITSKESLALVNKFLNVIKKNAPDKIIKISNFGSFFYKFTPKRIGRNPKTGTIYAIKPFNRFIFKPSFRLKFFLN